MDNLENFNEITEEFEEPVFSMENASLFIVATPIGNLGDISQRAIETLRHADLIAAEDTRHTIKLLNRLGIKNTLVSYHEYSDQKKFDSLITQMLEGKKIALVSDAGMPGISDPGSPLVAACIANNIGVTVIPGPCAVVTALPMSGIDARRFVFEGFIPRDKTRRDVISDIAESKRTVVFYESPHHLLRTLEEFAAIIPERKIAICRELTKIHEEVLRMSVSEAAAYFAERQPRGEFVIILEGKKEEIKVLTEEDIRRFIEEKLSLGMSRKDAAAKAVSELGAAKNIAKRIANEF